MKSLLSALLLVFSTVSMPAIAQGENLLRRDAVTFEASLVNVPDNAQTRQRLLKSIQEQVDAVGWSGPLQPVEVRFWKANRPGANVIGARAVYRVSRLKPWN